MRAATHRPRPAGFTLIEMVVVIGIIVILLAIGAAFLPGLQGNQKVQNGVDRVAQWLLIAKNRAKHDGLPTGLQLIVTNNPTVDPAPAGGYLTVNQLVYVQQPDVMAGDPAASNYCFTIPNPGTPPTYPPTQTVLFSPSVDFVGADSSNPSTYLVQPNDYLELFGGGGLLSIQYARTVSYNGVNYPALQLWNQAVSIPLSASGTGSTNWRIIRQPRRVPGEDVLTLPQDIVVDLSNVTGTGPLSQNVPGNNQILFSPSGDIIGQTAISGKILLWVRDATVPSPALGNPNMQGNPTLVAISARGGFLGTYPVLPLQFYNAALQGRSGF